MIKHEVTAGSYWVKIYMSGPIEIAKQVCRKECLRGGLCVTIEPSTFIYAGGEESGFVVGLINYPRFPAADWTIHQRALDLAKLLLEETHQHSVLIMTPTEARWLSRRDAS